MAIDFENLTKGHTGSVIGLLEKILNEENPVLITGYNLYQQNLFAPRATVITHMHQDAVYKKQMLSDLVFLGHDFDSLLHNIRDKYGVHRWNPYFDIVGSDNKPLEGLFIRLRNSSDFIDLNQIGNRNQIQNGVEDYIAFSYGWEINIPILSYNTLLSTLDMVLNKSCSRREDNNQLNEGCWDNAYQTPVIVIGAGLVDYKTELKSFEEASMFTYCILDFEANFIVQSRFDDLIKTSHYKNLLEFGFKKEACLVNRAFLEYINPVG